MFRNVLRLLSLAICLSWFLCFHSIAQDAPTRSKPDGHLSKSLLPLDQAQMNAAMLAQKRDKAAIKGLQWMDNFLDKDEHFKTMPFETYQFFHVCALTSSNAALQRMAKKAADKNAVRLKKHCLELNDPMERHDFLQLLEFISKHEHTSINFTPLIEKAKKNFTEYKNTADIYGTPVDDLTQAEWKGVFETLLYAYFLEKADSEFPNVFPVNYRLLNILKFLKARDYVNFADDTSEDKSKAVNDTFIITHIAYMLSNYSQLRLYEEDAPWLYDYLRRNFDEILAIGHTDLIGECVDVFRSLGYSEEDSPIVRKGTEYLISRQNDDGTWGEANDESGSAYNRMHPTSCAIWALRTRTFARDTKYDKRIRSVIRELNRETVKTTLKDPRANGLGFHGDTGKDRGE